MRSLFLVVMGSASIFALGVTDVSGAENRLRVSVFPFSPPLSFFAPEGGDKRMQGYTIDECLALGRELNADIEFVAAGRTDAQGGSLANGDIDLIAHASRPFADHYGLSFLPVGVSLQHHLYIHESLGSMSPDEVLAVPGERVVVVRGAPYVADVSIPQHAIEAPSALEALSLLDQGSASVYIAPSERVADFLIESRGLENVRKTGNVIGEAPLGLVADPDNPRQVALVRAALKKMERTGELARIRARWFEKKSSSLFAGFYPYLMVLLTSVVALFSVFTAWNVSLKRRVERATQKLKRTEQRYRDLIESSPDMIFLVTEKGVVLHANERSEAWLHVGFPLVGSRFSDLVPVGEKAEAEAFLDKIFHDGCDRHELKMMTGTAQPMEVEVAGRIIQGMETAKSLACLFARNVTERNRMEEELIQVERLGVIGKMAAGVAHEINNPLGIIRFNAEDMLYAEDMSDQVREGLSVISRNASRAADTIAQLLNLASPAPQAREAVDLGQMISDTVVLLGPKFKTVDLSVDMDETPVQVRGDRRALQQVMINLLLNALESMGGSGSVRIRGDCAGEGGPATVRLRVSDSGQGIERAGLVEMFEPFVSRRNSGFGLGLFISRRIVDRHGGIIFAESTPGKGACFTLEFPALEDEMGL